MYSEHLESEAEATQEHACAMGLGGFVSKQRNAPSRSGERESWIGSNASSCSASNFSIVYCA
jgi:bifunctional non-homologous end joining protein LigD